MTNIPLFIRLKTSQPLEKKDAVAWYNHVKHCLGEGMLQGVQTTNNNGEPDVAFMVRRESNAGDNYYVIPIVRDLTDSEFDKIKENYEGPEGVIETNSDKIETVRQSPADAIVMIEDDYNSVCEMLAKHQHRRWYEARASAGWSFGLEVDENDKKHPMMRPWEQLPDQYKDIDYDLPHVFMDLLVAQGFVVVSRDELNKWLNK